MQYQNMPLPTYIWQRVDEDFVLIGFNIAAAEFTNKQVAKLVGTRARETFQDRPDILEDLSRCFDGKVAIKREMSYRLRTTAEEKEFCVSYAFVPPDLIMVHAEDITERKRAGEQLRYQAALLASVNDAVVASDAQYRLTAWNEAAESLYGWKAEEVLGRNGLGILRTEWFGVDADRMRRTIAETGRWRGEVTQTRKDGTRISVELSAIALRDESGQITGYVSVNRDISERKRAEEALQRSRDQLRAFGARLQKVREEERAKVAREIHDELGQALTAIKIDLSSLSHELPADKKQQCESILKLAAETIQSVRRISTELRPAILDAVGLVAAVEWAAGEFAARTGTKCQLDLPQDDAVIEQERATALFRIFQETLTNVARHANATKVKVRLAKPDGNLTLEVHDNGRGVSEEQLSAGSSLGILGMRERAVLLGGELTITGARGEGTTVRVQIPETHPTPPKDDK
jgi:PAS domain S-box-containing protein